MATLATREGSAASSWTWDARAPVPRRERPARSNERRRRRVRIALPLGCVALVAAASIAAMWIVGERNASAHAGAQAAVRIPSSVARESAVAWHTTASSIASTHRTPAFDGIPEEITWVTRSAGSLKDLGRDWAIRKTTIERLNPSLAGVDTIPAGTPVKVYARTDAADRSVGAPNAGRLLRGVPLPENPAWVFARGRARAWGTAETVEQLAAALTTYARRNPDAPPVEIGDLSARHGGKIPSHHSHQSGRDVDILLVRADGDANAYSPARNWSLVRTLIDQGSVQRIFLNAKVQRWLKAAAVADVGEAVADRYFAVIRHEPGHTAHMHVRFACPTGHGRCSNSPR